MFSDYSCCTQGSVLFAYAGLVLVDHWYVASSTFSVKRLKR